MPSDRPHFQQVQQQFVRYLRDPTNQQPAVPAERMAVYQELLFNNVKGFLDTAYPVLSELLPQERWLWLTRSFFGDFRCHSPYFLQIAQQFLQFLQQLPPTDAPPFWLELAHYEWLELELATRQITESAVQWAGMSAPLQLSGLTEVVAYQYPVHQICQAFQPQQPTPTFLLLYRDKDDEVCFVALNQMSALILQLLQAQPGILFTELIEQLQHYVPQLTVQQLTAGATELFADFAAKGVVQTFQPD